MKYDLFISKRIKGLTPRTFVKLIRYSAYFGITASTEKKRFGASAIPKNVYVRLDDSFNADVLQLALANAVLA